MSATILTILDDQTSKLVSELMKENKRLRAALETIRDWPFDVRGDCVADARKLANDALTHGERGGGRGGE